VDTKRNRLLQRTEVDIRDYLSDDGQVVLALCSTLALPDNGVVAPFTLSQWNDLEEEIEKSVFKRPSALQGRNAAEIAQELPVLSGEAERIARLLDRAGRLAIELESLFGKGMWALTRVDDRYPGKLRDTLKHQAPSVLFGAGDWQLFKRRGVAVVGSRNIDEAGAEFAKLAGARAVASKMAVVSGGARGTDRIAMDGAIEADGVSLGVLADSLEATIRKSDVRGLVLEGRLLLGTPYAPTAGFSVGGAMGRNKLIYGLADFAVVVSSDYKTGGTWGGAVECLKAGWCPVFVREGAGAPKGNEELVKLGAVKLSPGTMQQTQDLGGLFMELGKKNQKAVEQDLFG
jgi:predicted Rossmann fold nucleotide-binding protein DprA/Smf involved in DNA uptake